MAIDYGLIDSVVAGALPEPKPAAAETRAAPPVDAMATLREAEAAREDLRPAAPGPARARAPGS
jgi:hypothetical protein